MTRFCFMIICYSAIYIYNINVVTYRLQEPGGTYLYREFMTYFSLYILCLSACVCVCKWQSASFLHIIFYSSCNSIMCMGTLHILIIYGYRPRGICRYIIRGSLIVDHIPHYYNRTSGSSDKRIWPVLYIFFFCARLLLVTHNIIVLYRLQTIHEMLYEGYILLLFCRMVGNG